METKPELLLITFTIISVVMGLFILSLLLRKLKPISESESKIKLSYAAWVFTLFVALSINTSRTLNVLSEAFDLISKMGKDTLFLNLFQISAIFIGLNILWFIVWFSISRVLTMILIGNRNIIKEMELDNVSYFLIRGVILIGIVLSFLTLYDSLLRIFLPSINIPFYN